MLGELRGAPLATRAAARELLALAEMADVTEEAATLQRAYVDTGIVGPRSLTDALHVAVATVARCTILVSWNFRHVAHIAKSRQYNAINMLHGYPQLAIVSPLEVVPYEDEPS